MRAPHTHTIMHVESCVCVCVLCSLPVVILVLWLWPCQSHDIGQMGCCPILSPVHLLKVFIIIQPLKTLSPVNLLNI